MTANSPGSIKIHSMNQASDLSGEVLSNNNWKSEQ